MSTPRASLSAIWATVDDEDVVAELIEAGLALTRQHLTVVLSGLEWDELELYALHRGACVPRKLDPRNSVSAVARALQAKIRRDGSAVLPATGFLALHWATAIAKDATDPRLQRFVDAAEAALVTPDFLDTFIQSDVDASEDCDGADDARSDQIEITHDESGANCTDAIAVPVPTSAGDRERVAELASETSSANADIGPDDQAQILVELHDEAAIRLESVVEQLRKGRAPRWADVAVLAEVVSRWDQLSAVLKDMDTRDLSEIQVRLHREADRARVKAAREAALVDLPRVSPLVRLHHVESADGIPSQLILRLRQTTGRLLADEGGDPELRACLTDLAGLVQDPSKGRADVVTRLMSKLPADLNEAPIEAYAGKMILPQMTSDEMVDALLKLRASDALSTVVPTEGPEADDRPAGPDESDTQIHRDLAAEVDLDLGERGPDSSAASPTPDPAPTPPALQTQPEPSAHPAELETDAPPTQPARPPVVLDGGDVKLAELVDAGEYALAAWGMQIAGRPDGQVRAMQLVTLAQATRSASGAVASRFNELIHLLDIQQLTSDGGMRQVLLASACRMAVIAPYYGPIPLLESLSSHALPGPLEQLRAAFLDAARQGIQLEAGAVDSDAQAQADEERLADLRARAVEHIASWPRHNSGHTATTHVLRLMVTKDDQPLARLLGAVATATPDESAVQQVRAAIADLTDDSLVDSLIETLDARPATNRDPIVGNARRWLESRLETAVALAGEWLDVAATTALRTQPDAKDRVKKAIEQLRLQIGQNRKHIATLVEESTANRPLARALGRAATTIWTMTLNTIMDGTPIEGPELPPAIVLGIDLTRTEDVRLADLQPVGPLHLDDMVDALGRTFAHAAAHRLQIGDLPAVRALAVRLDKIGQSAEAEQLNERVDEVASGMHTEVQRHRLRADRAMWDARAAALLDEDRLSLLAAEIEELFAQDSDNLHRLRGGLEDVHARLSEQVDLAKPEYIARLAGLEPEDAARVRAAIDAGDLATASEMLHTLDRGLPLAKTTTAATELAAFCAGLAEPRENVSFGLVTALRTGGRYRDHDLGVIDADTRTRLADGWEAWLALAEAGAQPDRMTDLLRGALKLIGWALPSRAILLDTSQDSRRSRLRVKQAKARGDVRVPVFNVNRKGVRIIVNWASQVHAEEIMEWLGRDGETPVVLLHLGPLARHVRDELAELQRRATDSPPTVIIDESLLAHLTMRGHDAHRWPFALDLALAWSNVNPFTPYAAGQLPQEMFYGRAEELQAVQGSQGTSLVYGGRQLGKSALLQQAKRRFVQRGGQHHAAYLDLKAREVGHRLSPDLVGVEAAKVLREADVPIAETHKELQPFLDDLVTWMLEDTDRHVLLLLDEADGFLQADAEVHFRNVAAIKDAMERTDRRFKAVFAGLHKVARFMRLPNQPLAHLGRPCAVGQLEPQDAYELLTLPLAALGYRFESEELPLRLLNTTNLQASIVQFVGRFLVKRMRASRVRDGAPPHLITARDVMHLLQDTELIQETRKRFRWTLDLDPRYTVIALLVAYHAAGEGAAKSRNEVDLLSDCRGWWPAGFADLTRADFRDLLEELMLLGVLASDPEDKQAVRLRTPNVLRLFGGDADDLLQAVADHIDRAHLAEAFKAASARVPLQDGPLGRSPLTEQRVGRLLEVSNRVQVVLGSAALGIKAVGKALKDAGDNDPRLRVSDRHPTAGGIRPLLLPKDDRGVLVVNLPDDDPSLAAKMHQGALDIITEEGRDQAIILVASPALLPWWAMLLTDDDPLIRASVQQLRRWDHDAIRAFQQDVEIPAPSEEFIKQTLRHTGGWPPLIQQALDRYHKEGGWNEGLQHVDKRLTASDHADKFIDQVGMPSTGPMAEVMDRWVLQFDGSQTDPDALEEDLEVPVPTGYMEILHVLSITQRTKADLVEVEPVFATAWRHRSQ